jgi:hypothetical protein
VAEEDGFDEAADEVLFVGVEVLGGFELGAEVVGGASFVGVEDEAVGGDVERDGEVIDLGLLVVVLFDPDSNTAKFGQFPNLVALRRDGSEFWVAELPSTSTGECYYRVREGGGQLLASSVRSIEVEIDPLTGKLVSREFTK